MNVPSPLLAMACLLGARLPTQQGDDWVLHQPWPAAANAPAAMAVQPLTGRPVRFGGFHQTTGLCPDLWEWDVDRWRRRVSSPSPELRSGHAMVTDTLRGEIVLFGGSGSLSRDTWTWNGVRWRTHSTPLLLAMRTGHAMAFDSQRGRTVLFGGGNYGAPLGDTWEWDGTSWLLCQPGAPPAPRYGHRLAFDAARGKVVLFGGNNGITTSLGDTWEWDGTYWTRRFPTEQPAARSLHALTYDTVRQRVVLFGGAASPLANFADTWEWNGTTWSQVHPTHSPPTHSGHALLYDAPRSRVVLFGATAGPDDVWEYDGIDWQEVPRAAAPASRTLAALVHDPVRGDSVLFGGSLGTTNADDTWIWDGDRWAPRSPTQAPSARYGSGIAFDVTRAVALLFGGCTSSNNYVFTPNDETWTWNGSTWNAAQPANRPPPRFMHALAGHAGSQQVVLFGGRDNTTLFGDTWTWDGTNWTAHAPATSPPARFAPALASDGQDALLYGGGAWTTSPSYTFSFADTWRWSGTNWLALQPAVSPASRYFHTIATDTDRGRVLVTGGIASSSVSQRFADTWAWDGANWSLLGPATTPIARVGAAMTHDALRRSTLLSGGSSGYGLAGDTWTFAPVGSESTFGAGCPGSVGTPQLQPSPLSRPEPGGTVIVELLNLPATIAILVVGFSNTANGAQALPLALQPFGMPGCDLLVSADATVLLMPVANAATWFLMVPHSGALQGVEFYSQAFGFDPGANAAGFVNSNAGRCRLGN